MKNIDTEDVLLVLSIVVAIAASLIDAVVASTLFKVLKIAALVLSLGLAWHRITTSKPFIRDISPEAWQQVGEELEVRISRKEHGRGKTPKPRALVKDPDGFAEGVTDMIVDDAGTVIYRVAARFPIRVEIRK